MDFYSITCRVNMLFDGAKDCTINFDMVGYAVTFEELKPKLQKSIDKYLHIFDKVSVICIA